MAKKPAQKPAAKKPAAKPPATKKTTKPAAKVKPKAAAVKMTSWFDAKSHKPRIGEYTQRLKPFIAAMADGQIDDAELAAQEERLVACMKKVEAGLSATMHEQVTELLCELTAYDVMQMLHTMQTARPKANFQG